MSFSKFVFFSASPSSASAMIQSILNGLSNVFVYVLLSSCACVPWGIQRRSLRDSDSKPVKPEHMAAVMAREMSR